MTFQYSILTARYYYRFSPVIKLHTLLIYSVDGHTNVLLKLFLLLKFLARFITLLADDNNNYSLVLFQLPCMTVKTGPSCRQYLLHVEDGYFFRIYHYHQCVMRCVTDFDIMHTKDV